MRAASCHAGPCHAMLCYAMLCYAMLCYAMLCYAMLCYAMLCYAMLCYAMLCYAMLCYAVPCSVHPMPAADKKHCSSKKSSVNAKHEFGGAMPCIAMLSLVMTAQHKTKSILLVQHSSRYLVQNQPQTNECMNECKNKRTNDYLMNARMDQ